MNTGPCCILSVVFTGSIWQHWFPDTAKGKLTSYREDLYRFIRMSYFLLEILSFTPTTQALLISSIKGWRFLNSPQEFACLGLVGNGHNQLW